jgi:hypothetical protein
VGDGWAAPIPSYLPYEKWQASNTTIDEAAREVVPAARALLTS